jgi:hypothetical protein
MLYFTWYDYKFNQEVFMFKIMWLFLSFFFTSICVYSQSDTELFIISPESGDSLQVMFRDVQFNMVTRRGSYLDSWEGAVQSCVDLGNGWRLPTLKELGEMSKSLYDKGRGNFKRGHYWSSESGISGLAYTLDISEGKSSYYQDDKKGFNYIRLVREKKYFVLDTTKYIPHNPELKIGDTYQGGIVAYIFTKGETGFIEDEVHGIIVSHKDLPKQVSIGCSSGFGQYLGQGLDNTNRTVSECGSESLAAKLCYDLNLNGFNDWFLPSKEELIIAIGNIRLLGGFKENQRYWSSSLAFSGHTFFCYFDTKNNSRSYIHEKEYNALSNFHKKTTKCFVRPFRYF